MSNFMESQPGEEIGCLRALRGEIAGSGIYLGRAMIVTSSFPLNNAKMCSLNDVLWEVCYAVMGFCG
jgi:hypothetical protein